MSESIQVISPQSVPDPMAEVWAVITPLLMPERAETLMTLTKAWVKEELQTYGKANHTDAIQLGIELGQCKAKFDMPDVGPIEVIGYRLQLSITGDLPPHPVVEVDCFFVQNAVSKLIDNVILSKPGHNASDVLQ